MLDKIAVLTAVIMHLPNHRQHHTLFSSWTTFSMYLCQFLQFKVPNTLLLLIHYSNWPIIERAYEGSRGLINCLRRHLLPSDGGPELLLLPPPLSWKFGGGGQSSPILSGLPSFKLQGRNISQNSKKNDHIQYWASRQPDHWCFTKGHTSILLTHKLDYPQQCVYSVDP